MSVISRLVSQPLDTPVLSYPCLGVTYSSFGLAPAMHASRERVEDL